MLETMPFLNMTSALLLFEQNWIPWFFAGGLLWAVISYFVGEQRGNGCLGCLLGFLLGPFGLLITALMGRDRG